MFLGFGGVITFNKADEVREAARNCPNDRILLETDAPYLAPVPFRGKRNEPAFTRNVAESLGAMRGASLDSLASATSFNAERLFPRLRGHVGRG